MSLRALAQQRCRVKTRLRLGQFHPGTEGEEYASAIGTIPMGVALKAVDLHPEVWDQYRLQYPDDWIKEVKFVVCPDREHPQGIQKWNEDKTEKGSGPATMSDSTLRDCPPSGSSPPPVRLMTNKQREERAKCYAEAYAKDTTNTYSRYGRFTMQVAHPSKFPKCWAVTELRTPQQEFKKDVSAGKILHWRTGLKMSDMEAKGKPPESGYLAAMTRGPEATPHESESYHRGLVIKITGDEDRDGIGYGGLDLHNNWAVITEVIDPWHYKVVPEDWEKEVLIRDTDVKAWIGDQYSDIFGLGTERWKSEVLPLIESTLKRFPR